MDWLKDKAQIEQREDGTYVVLVNIAGDLVPFHVTPDYSPELFAEVTAFLMEDENE